MLMKFNNFIMLISEYSNIVFFKINFFRSYYIIFVLQNYTIFKFKIFKFFAFNYISSILL